MRPTGACQHELCAAAGPRSVAAAARALAEPGRGPAPGRLPPRVTVRPARTLVALVKAQRRLGLPHRHRLVTLKRPAYPPLLLQAKQAGLEIVREPDPARLARELESADVAIIHFWNTPELYVALQKALP